MGVPQHSAARQSDALDPARPSFDTATITLHWISLLLVLAMVGTGLLYGRMENRAGHPPCSGPTDRWA